MSVLDALEHRAVEAARTVASGHGLTPGEPVIIAAGSNVLVRLSPAPVVARVMTGTVALHDDPRSWLEREVSVLEFLAPTGLAVAPSRVIPPGPHHHAGLWMTFTEWVPGVRPGLAERTAPDLDDARELGRRLRSLHDALAPFEGPLTGSGELRGDIERLLHQLRPADRGERDAIPRLGAELTALGPEVFTSSLPTQALHGDVSFRNLLRTDERLIWNDFEDTFRGPVHWDVASAVAGLHAPDADPLVVSELLEAYGWDDARELEPFLAAQDLYDEIWRMYDRQRRGSRASGSQIHHSDPGAGCDTGT